MHRGKKRKEEGEEKNEIFDVVEQERVCEGAL